MSGIPPAGRGADARSAEILARFSEFTEGLGPDRASDTLCAATMTPQAHRPVAGIQGGALTNQARTSSMARQRTLPGAQRHSAGPDGVLGTAER